MPSVALVTVGDELLLGQVVDTNSAWLGAELSARGITVGEILSVADRADAIQEAVQRGLAHHDVVITTGGLGPTKDDITKTIFAQLFSQGRLRRDEVVFGHIGALLAARGVVFNELNQAQADVPEGFVALENRTGTAPGLWYETQNGSLLIALPGVPFEMKELFEQQVAPRLEAKFGHSAAVHSTVLVYGLPESELAEKIAGWEHALPQEFKLAYLPNPRGIRLRLSAYGVVDKGAVERQVAEQFSALSTVIPEYYLGYEPTSLEAVVGALLLKKGATVATAESCTGGLIASRLTSVAGASAYVQGGVVAYSNQVKINTLGVKAAQIEQYGAVSQPVAVAMAAGVCAALGADYGVATSGVAGPSGGSAEKPVGTVCVAVADRWGGSWSVTKHFGQPREVCVARASSFALDALRHYLQQNFKQ